MSGMARFRHRAVAACPLLGMSGPLRQLADVGWLRPLSDLQMALAFEKARQGCRAFVIVER
jgi:hypothetical protein